MGANEAIVLGIVVFGMVFVVPIALWIVAIVRGRGRRERRGGGGR